MERGPIGTRILGAAGVAALATMAFVGTLNGHEARQESTQIVADAGPNGEAIEHKLVETNNWLIETRVAITDGKLDSVDTSLAVEPFQIAGEATAAGAALAAIFRRKRES